MAKTLLQLVADVQDTFVRPEKDALVRKAVNYGLREISKAHPWKALRAETTVAVAANATSVSGLVGFEPIEARWASGTTYVAPVPIVAKEAFVRQYPGVSVGFTGYPALAYYENGTLFLGPKVGTAGNLVITLLRSQPDLVADSDTPLIDADLAVVAWANSYCFASMGMFDQAGQWKSEAAVSLANAVNAEKRRVGLRIEQQPLELGNDYVGSATPWLDPFVL